MIKGFSLKSKQQSSSEESAPTPSQNSSVALLRIQKDLSDLQLPSNITLVFPDPKDLLNFEVYIVPTEGFYKNGQFRFLFKFKHMYPYVPPKVQCMQRVFHPNIDLQGNVCLNILREDWNPVLSLSAIIFGLQFLFQEPNTDDPLNHEAADLLIRNTNDFFRVVSSTMNGYSYNGNSYDNVLSFRKKGNY